MTSPEFGTESIYDLWHSAAAMLHDDFLSGLFLIGLCFVAGSRRSLNNVAGLFVMKQAQR